MSRQRLISLAVAGTALLAIAGFGISIATAPQYRALSADLTASNAAEIVRTLESAGYEPRLSVDGTMISLPEQDLARARMSLAEAGLPAAGIAGWELFDDQSGIGMNSFMQKVSRLRAMEGELSRSVQTLDTVEAARVHLVLPERETFSQDRPQPSASVIVRMRRGLPMQRSQAIAVRNLIAASVPGLSPEKVTVLSTSGETILAEESENSGEGLSTKRSAIEARLARNIESIISARVGAGNVRVQVAADLEESRQVVVQQSFNPDEKVARTQSSTSEQSEGSDGGHGGVDVANNMPGVELGAGGAGGSRESKSRSQDETTFEIGSTRSERVTEAGGIKRLTVAVIINGTVVDGQYTDRSADELESLSSLAMSAVGIDPERGDVVTVKSLQFVESADLLAEGEPASAMELLIAQNFTSILRGVIAIIVIAMVMIFGVRPFLRKIGSDEEATLANEADDITTQASDNTDEMEKTAESDASRPSEENDPSSFVTIESVRGGILRSYVDQLEHLVDKDPETSIRTLRSWINKRP